MSPNLTCNKYFINLFELCLKTSFSSQDKVSLGKCLILSVQAFCSMISSVNIFVNPLKMRRLAAVCLIISFIILIIVVKCKQEQ